MFKHQYLQMFGLKLNKYDKFRLKFVSRYRDPQLQLGKNLNKIT